MGSLKSPCTTSNRSPIDTIALNCLVFEKIAFLHFGVRSKMAYLRHLGFYGSNKGALKIPCRTFYRSSIATMARNCLLCEKIAFFCILTTDRRTDGQHRRTKPLSQSQAAA